ncbi:ketoacyl-ACP synthase III [Porticoccaceae bacterium]|nr:ketoacyl-ACP synthase III [Porticoccaceae bacterium]
MTANVLEFHNASIKGIVTVAGDKKVDFMSSYEQFGLSNSQAQRLAKVMGLSSRYVVSGAQTTSDLCFEAAEKVLAGTNTAAKELGGIIFVSQSPDFTSPATAISLQHRLGLNNASVCFDMRLGCSGFVYGLAAAYGFIEAGLDNILLCVGDVASKLVDPTDHAVAPIMGDAGSAILIQRSPSHSLFNLYSDGSGYDSLIIPNSGLRKEARFSDKAPVITMDGAAVFNFTLKRVPPMIDKIMSDAGVQNSDIDYLVMHQPNKYMLQNIKKKMKLDDNKVPDATQSVYGNQNSASIPGTINGFLGEQYSSTKLTSLVAGFGIGLSWGAAIITTDNIYAPKTFHSGE